MEPIEPEEEIMIPIIALYDGSNMVFYDGENFEVCYTALDIKFAGNKKISVGEYLYGFDDDLIPYQSTRLKTIPEYIFYDGSDLYNFSEYFVYKNGVSLCNFFFDIKNASITSTGELIAFNHIGTIFNLVGDSTPFKVFSDLYASNVNYDSKIAELNGEMVSFNENYFYGATWQKCGEKYYSSYGMEFSSSGFIENSTVLQAFKSSTWPYAIPDLLSGERPSLHPAGQRLEAGEYVAYFVDSTSGHLVRYVPSVDQYDVLVKIFIGPRNYGDGNVLAKTLDIQWVEDKMYFHHEGSIKVYDPKIQSVNIFYTDVKLWKW